METLHFLYNDQTIDFEKKEGDNVMVNATQMAKVFGKRIDHFLKSDHAKDFINELELTPFGGRSEPLTREEIIKTRNGANTFFHRILALKFAAWLDTKFELWVYSTIDLILLGHYREVREATKEKIQKQEELKLKKQQLIKDNPELAEIFELELKINEADKKRIKAMKAATAQLRFDLFPQG